jgi:hypothetical protein
MALGVVNVRLLMPIGPYTRLASPCHGMASHRRHRLALQGQGGEQQYG